MTNRDLQVEVMENDPPGLADLDPELLMTALARLTSREQARSSLVCKLFAVIVAEIGRTTSFMASTVGPLTSVVADLEPTLKAAPTIGLCFTVQAQSVVGIILYSYSCEVGT